MLRSLFCLLSARCGDCGSLSSVPAPGEETPAGHTPLYSGDGAAGFVDTVNGKWRGLEELAGEVIRTAGHEPSLKLARRTIAELLTWAGTGRFSVGRPFCGSCGGFELLAGDSEGNCFLEEYPLAGIYGLSPDETGKRLKTAWQRGLIPSGKDLEALALMGSALEEVCGLLAKDPGRPFLSPVRGLSAAASEAGRSRALGDRMKLSSLGGAVSSLLGSRPFLDYVPVLKSPAGNCSAAPWAQALYEASMKTLRLARRLEI